jgi:hypothetical protein
VPARACGFKSRRAHCEGDPGNRRTRLGGQTSSSSGSQVLDERASSRIPAGVAQQAERSSCKREAIGSSPFTGSDGR